MMIFNWFTGAAFPMAFSVCLLGVCTSSGTQMPIFKSTVGQDSLPYQIDSPVKNQVLQYELLREISALGTTPDPNLLVAIADEKGEFYLLDVNTGKIKERFQFKDHGDFEGVEWVGNTVYALKSNGKIYAISGWNSGNLAVDKFETDLGKRHDLEGLGYDAGKNILLLAMKEDPVSDTTRCIMGFDLNSKQLLPNPVYTIDPREVNELMPNGPQDKPNFFSPSGIAVHPDGKSVYVLSSAKKRLVEIDYQSGKIKSVYRIDKGLLRQPEGICFNTNGDMFICSEGKKGAARLLQFKYRR